MCLFFLFLCAFVSALLPLSQDPSVCVTMGTACFLYRSLLTPRILPSAAAATTTSLFFFPSLLYSLVSVLPWRHMSVSSPACYLFHMLPRLTGSLSSVCLSVSARPRAAAWFPRALAFPFSVCSLFVCLFVLRICLSLCLQRCVRPCLCVCFPSHSFLFSLSLAPAHWLPVWPPGFSTSNPSSPLSALLLGSDVPPRHQPLSLSLSFPFFFSLSQPPQLILFVPTSKQYPLNATRRTHSGEKRRRKKERKKERKEKGRDLGNFRRRQLLLWRRNFWICRGERWMNRGMEGGRENV